MKHIIIFFTVVLLFSISAVKAQDFSNLRQKKISLSADTVFIDTLSIIPGTVIIRSNDQQLDSTFYHLDENESKITWIKSDRIKEDSVEIRYRVFPLLFNKTVQLRDRKLMEKGSKEEKNPFLIERPNENSTNIFGLSGLNKSGSISRGITIGNNQDAVVNSSLNLQLSGKLSNNIEILAAITDDNVPIQAEGNTQQLQEFDKVFIQLSNPEHKLIAGDFEVKNPDGYFMRYFKKAQGGLYSYQGTVENDKGKKIGLLGVNVAAAISKGKFARNTFTGIESNQGPYRLRGAENENFIVILSGSEKIYLDGIQLDRGQDRDYVIDYNTAEITFTTKRIITKDSRIVAEFQYSDKNYARTMLNGGATWQQKKFRSYISVFSEQDSKNQPLQQDLSSADKLILANAGDDLSEAFAPNVDSVAFNPNEILYARRDTIINAISYTGIYVYSTNSDSAKFRVGFANVGFGNGNYIAVDGITNGRVYTWIAPVGGIPQGTYEPKVQLVSPKQRRLITAGGSYDIAPTTKVAVELANSKDDLNRFSKLDKGNDYGNAFHVSVDHSQKLKRDTIPGWIFTGNLQTEFTDKNFKPVENYRSQEFTRDWNTTGLIIPGNEFFSSMLLGLKHYRKGEIHYGLRSYLRDTQYQGLMNILGGQWNNKGFMAKADGSFLHTQGTVVRSSYLRHREEVNKQFGNWIPGIKVEQEHNEVMLPGSDTLSFSSFSFRIAEVYIQRPDTSKLPLRISASRRYDDGLFQNEFKEATIADMLSMNMSYVREKHRLSGQINYRNLQVKDSLVTAVRDEESVGGRLDYSLTALNNALQFNTFYEGGTGSEPKKLYSYIAVASGTGTYTWKDYNADGIPQLNEFEAATFQDEANYIRVFTPTDDYVKVFFNQFNAVVNFNPAALITGNKKRPFITRFSVQSSVRFDNRIANEKGVKGWNPFPKSIADTALLSTQTNSRHTLYYNRSNPDFGADITWQDQQSRQLLSNGIESRSNNELNLTCRYNGLRWIGFQTSVETGEKKSKSEAFATRDFTIERYNIEQKINLQPGTIYRFTLSYRNENKKNILTDGMGEKAIVQDGGIEWRYSSVKRGIISTHFNLVNIDFNADPNTAIAYEMLEGLKAGTNLTWGFSLQRNLGNSFQVSINYEGRKPAGIKVIHTGGMQVRAYF